MLIALVVPPISAPDGSIPRPPKAERNPVRAPDVSNPVWSLAAPKAADVAAEVSTGATVCAADWSPPSAPPPLPYATGGGVALDVEVADAPPGANDNPSAFK